MTSVTRKVMATLSGPVVRRYKEYCESLGQAWNRYCIDQRKWSDHCFYCGSVPFYITSDHIFPKAMGGYVTVPCCESCNRKKRNLLPFEFRKVIHDARPVLFFGETMLKQTINDPVLEFKFTWDGEL